MGTSNLIGSFQTQVNLYNPIGVEGDFASRNPRATALTPNGGAFVAGPNGVTIGNFAWIASDGITVNSYATGAVAPSGFVHRDQQGLLTEYLQAAGMLIPPGFPVTLMVAGDFLDLIVGGSSAVNGSSCYARYSDGALFIGSAPSGTTGTGSIGSTNTAAIGSTSTGTAVSGTPNQITLSTVTGVVSIGDTVSGTGITAGTTIVAQISGTTGGAGVYELSANNTASAATITTFGKTLVVSATTGLISIGDTVSGGAGFPVGATIVSQVSGTTGGAGTYTLSAPATAYVASAAGVTTFGVVLDVTAVTGTLAICDAVTGTGVPAGATLASQVSGAVGGVGVYTLDIPATAYAASTALTVVAGILTDFVAKSAANVGQLVQISTW